MTRILLVDDQPTFLKQLQRLLLLAGHTLVGEAGTVLQAETLVTAVHPDLVVLDMMLPGMNGLEGTAVLQSACPELRVILISAFQDASKIYETSALAAGAEAFYSKDELDLDLVRGW